MAEIVAFRPSTAKPKRPAAKMQGQIGELVFFTGVRYEHGVTAETAKPKRFQPASKPRLKSKA